MSRLEVIVRLDGKPLIEIDREVRDVRVEKNNSIWDSGKPYMQRTWELTGEHDVSVNWRDLRDPSIE